MIFCPILFYGGAQEHDIDFDQFSILFRSIFLEGLGPAAGRHPADSQDAGPAVQGTRRRASSAGGRGEHRRPRRRRGKSRPGRRRGTRGPQRPLLGRLDRNHAAVRRRSPRPGAAGRPAVVRRVDLDPRRPPRCSGYDKTIVFYNDSERVPLREARRSGRPAQRDGLLAEQFRLCRAAERRRDAHLGAGQLRALGGAGGRRHIGRRSSLGTTGWRRRRCGSCPISARRWSRPTCSRR